MLQLKNAPGVQVQETKTFKMLKARTFEEKSKIKQVRMLDITDNDREFLEGISYASKFIVEDGNCNDFTYYISLSSSNFNIMRIALQCISLEANSKIAKFITDTFDEKSYTDIIIHSYDSDFETDYTEIII